MSTGKLFEKLVYNRLLLRELNNSVTQAEAKVQKAKLKIKLSNPLMIEDLDALMDSKNELEGAWEKITLNYTVTPGFANEQTVPDFQLAVNLTLDPTGTINSDVNNQWSYNAPWLELNFNNVSQERVLVERGRDWENKKPCLIFTGLSDKGIAVWGKK